MKKENPVLASEFSHSFEQWFKTGDVSSIETLVQKILSPYGGLLWDGFKSDAPQEWKYGHEAN